MNTMSYNNPYCFCNERCYLRCLNLLYVKIYDGLWQGGANSGR